MKRSIILLIMAGALVLSGTVSAASIVNGGFEADGGNSCPMGPPSGWTGVNCAQPVSLGRFRPREPTSRLWAAAAISQACRCRKPYRPLTVGHSYTASFDLGGENYTSAATEQVQVSMLSGSSTGSQIYDAPHSTGNGTGDNLWNNWSLFSYTFLASGTSATIDFANVTSANNDTGIDNVSIADVTGTGTVPEPGTLLLFGPGAACVTLLRYRNRHHRTV